MVTSISSPNCSIINVHMALTAASLQSPGCPCNTGSRHPLGSPTDPKKGTNYPFLHSGNLTVMHNNCSELLGGFHKPSPMNSASYKRLE